MCILEKNWWNSAINLSIVSVPAAPSETKLRRSYSGRRKAIKTSSLNPTFYFPIVGLVLLLYARLRSFSVFSSVWFLAYLPFFR